MGKNVQAVAKNSEDWRRQPLGENVGILRAWGYVKDASFAESHPVMNEVQVNLNMLSALMLGRVARKIRCVDIVTIHDSSTSRRKLEFMEKLTQPARLSHTVSNASVLSFCTRTRDGWLPLRRPRNKVVTEKNTES